MSKRNEDKICSYYLRSIFPTRKVFSERVKVFNICNFFHKTRRKYGIIECLAILKMSHESCRGLKYNQDISGAVPYVVRYRSRAHSGHPVYIPAPLFPHIPSIIRAIDKTELVPPEIPRRRRRKFFFRAAPMRVKVKACLDGPGKNCSASAECECRRNQG